MEKKKCQIYAGLPITCFEVPIIGHAELNLTEDEIYKCLCAKAEVIEILSNGKRINLDFTNYNKNNNCDIQIDNEEPIAPPEVQTPEIIEETEEVLVVEDKVEVKEDTEVEESDIVEETPEESDEYNQEETAVADTVKSYQVASRNNKKSKNNKK